MPNISNVLVASGTGLSTAGNGGRKLVRLANGWFVSALWDEPNKQIKLQVSKDDYATTPTQLCYVGLGAVTSPPNISLVSIGTKIYMIAWRDNGVTRKVLSWAIEAVTQSNVDIYTSFSALETTDQNASGATSLSINEAGTELHAAWSSKNATYPNSFNIRYAKGTINGDGSVTWGAVEQVTTSNSSSINHTVPSIVINALQQPIIIWEHNDNTSSLRIINQSRKVNGSWTAVSNSSGVFFGSTTPQKNPVALFVPQVINGLASGRLWVAWHFGATKFNIRAAHSDDGGVTWTAPVDLTSGSTFDRLNVTLSADKTGKVFALYEDHQWSPDLDIYMRTFSNGSWGAPVAVAEAEPAAETNPSALVNFSLQMTTPPFVFTNATDGIRFSGNFNVGASVSPVSGVLGNKETTSITAYTVTPEAGSTITQIVERINGVIVNTFNNPASLSRTLTAPNATWDTLAYFASHTASIAVTDSNGAQTVTTYSFAKTLATNASLLEATKANADAKNRISTKRDALAAQVGLSAGSTFDAISAQLASGAFMKVARGTFTSFAQNSLYTVNTLAFRPKIVIIQGRDGTTRFQTTIVEDTTLIGLSGVQNYSMSVVKNGDAYQTSGTSVDSSTNLDATPASGSYDGRILQNGFEFRAIATLTLPFNYIALG